MRRLLIFIVALLLLVPAQTVQAQATVAGVVGQYRGLPVYLVESPNRISGDIDYLIGSLPDQTRFRGPYPIVIFVNPYSLFMAPPSHNQADVFWNNYIGDDWGQIPDVSVPEWGRYRGCYTPNGECLTGLSGRANLSSLYPLGEVNGKSYSESNVNWALDNGYAVAVYYARHYAGRETGSLIVGLKNMIRALKNMPGVIDPNRIGVTGRSQGGHLSIHPLIGWSFDPDQLNIAAAVAEAGWVDGPRILNYYDVELAQAQPPALWQESINFMVPFYNRIAMTFGPDASGWGELTQANTARRFNTPIMILSSTDDMMCPAVEQTSFHEELQSQGKTSYLWQFKNGPPPLATRSVPQQGHGLMDVGHGVQTHIMTRYMFIRHMPPDGTVVMEHPSEVDLVGMIREMADQYFDPSATQADRDNLLRLAYELAGNPQIWYNSTDPRVPSGPAPNVIGAVINYVLATR